MFFAKNSTQKTTQTVLCNGEFVALAFYGFVICNYYGLCESNKN